MPKLYEYFGLIFYSDDHDPMHLHVQHGDREGVLNAAGVRNAVRRC